MILLFLVAAVAVSAEPPLLRLGTDSGAVLHVRAPSPPGVTVSAGSVSAPKAAKDGTFEVAYKPPDDAVPQVAIVTAVAGDEVGWIAIPLWGQGDALVKTRPHARISVDIGARTFGPARADAQGQALVPVVVPPGVTHARQGQRAIDLHVPPMQTVHVALGAAGPADRPQSIPVWVVAVEADGAPRAAARLVVRADRGEIAPVSERAAGLYESTLTLGPGAAGPIAVTAALEEAPLLPARASLRLGPGPARSIELEPATDRIVASDAPLAHLHAVARDGAGNAAVEELHFETSFGTVAAVAKAAGEWDLTLAIPPVYGGRTAVEVRAYGGAASATRSLALVAAAPASAAFDAPAAVVADGVTPVRLPLHVRDRYGNEIPSLQAGVSADRGHAELESGVLAARYLPPRLRESGDSTVEAHAGEVSARARLLLLPYRPSAVVSPKLGWLSNLSGFSAPLAGVEASLRTDRFGPQIGVALEADYALRTQSERVSAGALADSRTDLLLLHASALLRGAAGQGSTAWVGAGPTAAAYWSRVGISGAPPRRGFAIAPGLQAAAGIERRIGPALPFLELRAGWVSAPDLPTLSGPLRSLSLTLGVRLEAL